MWFYRRMLRISWTEKTTDEKVLERLNFKAKITNIIKTRKLKYFGHLQRHDTLQRRLMEGRVDGKRLRGRPRQMWVDNITHWTGRPMTNIRGAAADRKYWRDVVQRCMQQDT